MLNLSKKRTVQSGINGLAMFRGQNSVGNCPIRQCGMEENYLLWIDIILPLKYAMCVDIETVRNQKTLEVGCVLIAKMN